MLQPSVHLTTGCNEQNNNHCKLTQIYKETLKINPMKSSCVLVKKLNSKEKRDAKYINLSNSHVQDNNNKLF